MQVLDEAMDEAFKRAVLSGWNDRDSPAFMLVTPYVYAAVCEFNWHGHCRMTDAIMKGLREAERLLAIQYRIRN